MLGSADVSAVELDIVCDCSELLAVMDNKSPEEIKEVESLKREKENNLRVLTVVLTSSMTT